jgi:hypothetical protein
LVDKHLTKLYYCRPMPIASETSQGFPRRIIDELNGHIDIAKINPDGTPYDIGDLNWLKNVLVSKPQTEVLTSGALEVFAAFDEHRRYKLALAASMLASNNEISTAHRVFMWSKVYDQTADFQAVNCIRENLNSKAAKKLTRIYANETKRNLQRLTRWTGLVITRKTGQLVFENLVENDLQGEEATPTATLLYCSLVRIASPK